MKKINNFHATVLIEWEEDGVAMYETVHVDDLLQWSWNKKPYYAEHVVVELHGILRRPKKPNMSDPLIFGASAR